MKFPCICARVAVRFFLFCLSAAIIAAGLLLIDAPSNPEFDRIVSSGNVPADEDNGFYAFAGICAPEGQDPHAYGMEKVRAAQEKWRSEKHDLSFWMQDTRSAKGNLSYVKFAKENGEDADSQAPKCEDTLWGWDYYWLIPVHERQYRKQTQDDALSEQDVFKIADSFTKLNERYKSLAGYPRFFIPDDIAHEFEYDISPDASNTIHLLHIVAQARGGNAETAMSEWLSFMKFLNTAIADEQHMDMLVMLSINRGQSMDALRSILEADPRLAALQEKEILAALAETREPDLKSALRAEYRLFIAPIEQSAGIADRWLYKKNATRNIFWNYYTDLQKIAGLPPAEATMHDDAEQPKTPYPEEGLTLDHVWASLYNRVGHRVAGDVLGVEKSLLVDSYWRHIAYRRMNAIYVMALARKVAPEAMPAFLKALPEEFRDPYTEEPFPWDAGEKALVLNTPNETIGYVSTKLYF